MTKTIVERVREAYKDVFGQVNKGDEPRLALLADIIEGQTCIGNKQYKIEEAVAIAEKENPESKASLSLRTMQAMREWYLKPDYKKHSNIVECITDAGMNVIDNSLPGCLQVLKADRIRVLKDAFNKAFDVKDEITRSKAIHAAAEVLIAAGIPTLANYAITHMAEYQSKLKKELDKVVERPEANDRDTFFAMAPLLASQVTHLKDYAIKKIAQNKVYAKAI